MTIGNQLRLASCVLLPFLIPSCNRKQDEDFPEILKQVTETAASNEILREDNLRLRDRVDALNQRTGELESQSLTEKTSREEIIRRLKELEIAQSTRPAALPESPPAAAEEKTNAAKPAPALEAEPQTATAPSGEVKDIPTSLSNKVVVIEGDAGRGTGFLCTTEGSLWLYTAAHVISGNKTITVRDQQNNRYQTFESMEVAEGVDLVRLKIANSTAGGLELENPEKSAEIGDPIAAIGNSDGTGVVAPENGEILGKGPDSWEVSTEIIPGNSGGPVLSRKDGKVIGIVTHLLLGKKETWAADTRFAEVRRFAARLDRSYKWTPITPARFLKEYQIIAALDDDTKLGYAAILIYQSRFSSSYRQEAGGENGNRWGMMARDMVQKNPNHPITVTLNKILNRSTNYSATESRRELFEGIRSSLIATNTPIKPEAFTWYHRESYQQSLIWRRKLLEQIQE